MGKWGTALAMTFGSISLAAADHRTKVVSRKAPLPEPYNSVELLPFEPHGWYRWASIIEDWFKILKPKVVIEVGCWFGKSTRHMASLLEPGGVVYAVDHWLGSPEHQPGEIFWTPKLACLYEQFLSNVIHARLTDKIIPVRMASLEGSKYLAHIRPDFIYIDANHSYEAVYADIAAWFPLVKGHGVICGDDYLDGEGLTIKRAVDQFAADNQLTVHNLGSFWYYEE